MPGPLPPNIRWAAGHLEIVNQLVTLKCIGYQINGGITEEIGVSLSPILADDVWVRLTAGSVFGSTVTTDSTVFHPATTMPSWDWNETETGTYSIDVSVGEWSEFVALDAAGLDADNFPQYGGTAQKDGQPGYAMVFYEATVPSTTLTATISCAGVTATASHSTGATPVRIYSYATQRTEFARMSSNATFGALVQATLVHPDTTFDDLYTYTDGTSTVYALGTLAKAQIDYSSTVAGDTKSVRFWAGVSPKYRYALSGRLRSFLDAYPGSQTVIWQYKDDGFGNWVTTSLPANPNFAGTVAQRFFFLAGELNGEPTPVSAIDERRPQRAWLSPATLSASGEDTRDWRLEGRGRAYDSFTLAHAATITIEDGASASEWTAGANTTVSATGGAIRLVVSGGTGSATMALATPKDFWERYRYVIVRIRSTVGGSKAWRLTANGKQWDGTTSTAGTYTDTILDLCGPFNKSGPTDGQDYRWPLTPAGATEGDFWGLNTVASFAIENLVDGETYEIDAITLSRQEWAKMTHLPEFLGWVEKDTSVANRELKRLGILDVDGRVGFDHAGQERSGSPWVYEYLTLTQWIARLNEGQGLTATAAGSFPSDGFHDNSRFALWAGGLGATYDYTTALWQEEINRDLALGTITVNAQAIYDQWQGYPGIGKGCWTGAAHDTADLAMPIAITKHLRGQAAGLVFDPSTHLAKPLQAIDTYETTGLTPTGSDITGTRGEFLTELPYGRGNRNTTTKLVPAPLTDSEVWQNRRRARTVFKGGGPSVEDPWLLQLDDGSSMQVQVESGNVVFYGSEFSVPAGWPVRVVITSTGSCSRPIVSLDRQTGRVYAYWEYSAGIYSAYSDDRGRTWSAGTLFMASATSPIRIDAQSGESFVAWFEFNSGTSGPGKAKGQFREKGDTAFSATFTFKDSAAADLVFDERGWRRVDKAHDSTGRWTMAVVIDGDTAVSNWYSVDRGRTWTRL